MKAISKKKQYERPGLQSYGTVSSLTAGGSGEKTEKYGRDAQKLDKKR